MSTPSEPGQPGAGETAGRSNGSAAETPPWQRGAARQATSTRQATGEVRASRYITGTAAPMELQDARAAEEAEVAEREAAARELEAQARLQDYGSELPDLSDDAPARSTPARRESAARPTRAREGVAGSLADAKTTVMNRIKVAAQAPEGHVRATMQIRRIDPWTTLKVSGLLSTALFFVWMIAVAFLYLVLGGMGVWSKLNSNVGDLLTSTSGSGELVSASTIFGGAFLIGLLNIVLLTAMATIGALIYNLSTDIVGGIEVTLADRD